MNPSTICLYCERRAGKSASLPRRCKYNDNKRLPKGKQCKSFKPSPTFYCNLTRQRHHLLNCFQRRFNINGYQSWSRCKSGCRQFPNEIKEVFENYILGDTHVSIDPIEPMTTKKKRKEKRKIKRRKKRTIKRR